MLIHVTHGDITALKSDALVTLINSEGYWFGGVDSAIQRVAGGRFHAQASFAIKNGAKDGDAIYADLPNPDELPFKAVLFVIDDLQLPLSQLVYQALMSASALKAKKLALPAFRMGVMRGVVEKTIEDTIAGIKAGIDKFNAEGDNDMDITFVVWNDPEVVSKLRGAFDG